MRVWRSAPLVRHSACLLFFAGWAMDEAPFAELRPAGHDLVVVSDYRRLAPLDLAGLRSSYDKLRLVAWSMGVYVAGLLLHHQAALLDEAVAVAGTPQPFDERLGIPGQAVEDMLADFTTQTMDDFYAAMFEHDAERRRFLARRPWRRPEELAEELRALRDLFHNQGACPDLYDRVAITSRDTVMPPRNQVRAWGRERSETLQTGHFPFYRTGLAMGQPPRA